MHYLRQLAFIANESWWFRLSLSRSIAYMGLVEMLDGIADICANVRAQVVPRHCGRSRIGALKSSFMPLRAFNLTCAASSHTSPRTCFAQTDCLFTSRTIQFLIWKRPLRSQIVQGPRGLLGLRSLMHCLESLLSSLLRQSLANGSSLLKTFPHTCVLAHLYAIADVSRMAVKGRIVRRFLPCVTAWVHS